MPNLCLYFRIHQPVAIRKVSFFDFGSIPDLIDRGRNTINLKKRLESVYLPAFSLLFDLISKHQGAFQLTLSVNGMLLEQASCFFPSHFKEIRDFMNLEEVEMVASSYFHSLAAAASLDEFRFQLHLDHEKIMEITGKKPVIFSNPDLSFKASLAEILNELQMKIIFFRPRQEIQKNRNEGPFLYDHPKFKNAWLFPVYPKFSDTFTKGPLLPKRESERLIIKMVDDLKARASRPTAFLIDLDDPVGSEIRISKKLDFLKHFIDRCLSTGGNDFRKPSQLLENTDRFQKRFVADQTILDGGSIPEENILAKDVMRYMYSLEKRIKGLKDQNLLFQWRILQSYDYLQKLCSTDPFPGGKFPGSVKRSTPHEVYLTLMNALSALDIYIKN